MSAQKLPPRGVFGAIAGIFGFSAIAGVLVTAMVTPALAVTGITATSTIGFFDSLPEFIELGDQPQMNEIFAITGVDAEGAYTYGLIAKIFGDQNRQEVDGDEISQFVKDATIDGEDRRFYDHGGVDLQGVVRAALQNTAGGEISSGASTLTMQLVKNIYIQQCFNDFETQDEVNACIEKAQASEFDRKLKEMKLAIGLEKRYTKEEILVAYLNIAGFGGTVYGIEAAAQRYYGLPASDVTIAQAASLIAIVQEPGARSLGSPDNYANNKERRDVILGWMLSEKSITQEQYDEAMATPVDETTVKLTDPLVGCIAAYTYARYFCDYVVKSVKDLESLGSTEEERRENWKIGGYDVYTSLDLRIQPTVQDSIASRAPADETRLELGSAGTSVENSTGRILTMAQNKQFNDSLEGAGIGATAVNFNTDRPYGGSGGFQVGSTYKLFTLLNWLENSHGLNEVVNASARPIKQSAFTDTCNGPYGANEWKFKNSSGESGTRSVMAATAQSVNGAYASMALQLDLCDIKKTAEKLGVHTAIEVDYPSTEPIDNELNTFPSSILGTNDIAPLTMASAYATVANNGIYCKPTAVDRIVTASGEELPGQKADCAQVLDPEVAAAAAYALEGAMRGYASRDSRYPMMAKTGTTDASVQTWLVGSSSQVTTAIWFGNIKGKYSISRYPGGINNRHFIAKPIFAAINDVYGGVAFPEPPARLLTGAGIEVPDFVGGTPENAGSVIDGLGLTWIFGGEIDSPHPAGTVAAVTPGAGTVVARGMELVVFTSRGNMSTVPDAVTGNPNFNTARGVLNSAGFSTVTEGCTVVPAGDPNLDKVVASDPAAGTSWVRTNAVTLAVGKLACT